MLPEGRKQVFLAQGRAQEDAAPAWYGAGEGAERDGQLARVPQAGTCWDRSSVAEQRTCRRARWYFRGPGRTTSPLGERALRGDLHFRNTSCSGTGLPGVLQMGECHLSPFLDLK